MLLCAGAITAIYFYRSSGGESPALLASYLPPGEGTLVYLDVGALRRSGILDLIVGKKAAADLEYESFVNESKFDYRDDLQAVLAFFQKDEVFMIVRGRFDWKSLNEYAERHGGSCNNGYCSTPGSKPERIVSFYPVRQDLMALAVSRESGAAYNITKRTMHKPLDPPFQPVWAILTGPGLKSFTALPSVTGPFATALENAEQIVVTLGEAEIHLQMNIKVTCQSSDKASLLMTDLQMNTDRLRRKLAEDHKEANPDDLTGILSSGTFERHDRTVTGVWPVRRTFVEALAGGNYQ